MLRQCAMMSLQTMEVTLALCSRKHGRPSGSFEASQVYQHQLHGWHKAGSESGKQVSTCLLERLI